MTTAVSIARTSFDHSHAFPNSKHHPPRPASNTAKCGTGPPSSTTTSGCAKSRTPKSSQYLEAENAYTEAHDQGPASPSAKRSTKRCWAASSRPISRCRSRRGDYLYYSRTEEGKQYPIQCRRKGSMEAPEEMLLDLNELAKDHKFVGLGELRGQRRPEPAGLHASTTPASASTRCT